MRIAAFPRLGLTLLLCLASACFHAVVETGRPLGSTVVTKPWVSTFIFGLVPAQTINVAATCPGGIARVETQESFVNGLVGILTLGIYTPQSATITCAASRTGSLPTIAPDIIADGASLDARRAAVDAAAERAAASNAAVLVRF